jgi:hypothetical protein
VHQPLKTPAPARAPHSHGMLSRMTTAERAVPSTVAGENDDTAPVVFDRSLGSIKGDGFFNRMFPKLKGFTAPDAALEALAASMKDTQTADPALDNANVPSGFTYLGQFIDHDITLDLTPLSAKIDDPTMIRNFRTPGLDLDSLYGAGQGPHRFLYARNEAKFLIGTTTASPDNDGNPIPALPNDLERSRHGVALIGDHRNDENLLVAQTHLAFVKFHNKVVDHLAAAGTAPEALFDEASKTVRRHYQWIVLHDFIARITLPGTISDVVTHGRHFYKFKELPFMPLEFAGAAYRLGHTMVREAYSHNRVFRPGSNFPPGTLQLLFQFTGLSGNIGGEAGPLPGLPSNWIIDWRRFYDFNTPANTPKFELNLSRRLDPLLAPALHALPGFGAGAQANLAFRNLKRGVVLELPSGQDVAKFMAKKIAIAPLTPQEIATGPDGQVAKQHGFDTATPLWYYILKEAQVRGNGERLGPVGSRIVAEVFVGLLEGDKDSFLNEPNWKPTLPAKAAGTFTMTDMLQFVGDISPIDGITTVSTL